MSTYTGLLAELRERNASNAGLRKERDDARRERDELRAENERLRVQLGLTPTLGALERKPE